MASSAGRTSGLQILLSVFSAVWAKIELQIEKITRHMGIIFFISLILDRSLNSIIFSSLKPKECYSRCECLVGSHMADS